MARKPAAGEGSASQLPTEALAPAIPSLKDRVRRWVPPDAIALGNAILGRGIRFKGEYATWAEAEAHATGYQAQAILDRAVAATETVRSGRGAFDCDGVSFAAPVHPFPLLAGLLLTAARDHGRLSALDFGGALGSSYFQCRPWLNGLEEFRWTIVEQEHFVAAGRQRFETEELRFASSIGEAVSAAAPNVALLSGVLQYLSEPARVLAELADAGPQTIVIDRTPQIDGPRSIITVQHVPAEIVKSSYPARLFTLADLIEPLAARYSALAEFDGRDGVILSLGRRIEFKGMILTKR
jgi:putative methyltransferase (TIGR04325 family)